MCHYYETYSEAVKASNKALSVCGGARADIIREYHHTRTQSVFTIAIICTGYGGTEYISTMY